jgi:4-aminobutyrate aminotransferase-like enzyme/Ser/Thr protein kinase RdoA (MazF antagonist)
MDYSSINIDSATASSIAKSLFGIEGSAKALAGELDFNFKIDTDQGVFVLKVSRPDSSSSFLDFQQNLLMHVAANTRQKTPIPSPTLTGEMVGTWKDPSGRDRVVRLLSWMEGRLWSSVNPHSPTLLQALGTCAGDISNALSGFEHIELDREFEWDVAQSSWVGDFIHLFNQEERGIIEKQLNRFNASHSTYSELRKCPVHNDVNDNNIVVSSDKINPEVIGLIDYGDAVCTQLINDVAITLAYGMMGKANPLESAQHVVEGYHKAFPLLAEELKFLHNLVAMRLIISVTKAAINKDKEPENEYLQVSDAAAWDLLRKWSEINEAFAHYSFRNACGFEPHPQTQTFVNWSANSSNSVTDLFPSMAEQPLAHIDLSIGSTWLGHESEMKNEHLMAQKFEQLLSEPLTYAGGYAEIRPLYDTPAFERIGNLGIEYRTMHTGVDFWVIADTPIHSILQGRVHSIHDNAGLKDYGPTLILEHIEDGVTFYSLYGHLSRKTLDLFSAGDRVKKGDLIAYVGYPSENGGWPPHLHFQIIMDLLGNEHDFPGVAHPTEANVWKSICPDPNLLFKEKALQTGSDLDILEPMARRSEMLGKSLSLSYKDPLKIVRGSGTTLIDHLGRRFLDTVNNVAHVGHEHVRVVHAGQSQMGVLNTNTRYVHDTILEFAEELLATFPKELSVVHFVNSGSEANELALRMAKAATTQKDMIAVEVGYHGNTAACIDISSYKFDGKGGDGAPENTHIVPLPDTFRGLHQGENSGTKYAAYLEQSIVEIENAGRGLAGFICESIVSCGGQIELPEGYLSKAYQIVREAGGVCIADEVQVGCGRVGSHFWGFELHDVVPDIVTIGKPIGNGHPLAAVVCTQEVAEAFANGMEFFNTFGGNPVSSAIGLEVLKVIEDESLQSNAYNIGQYLIQELKNLQSHFPIIGDVRGKGLFLGIELVDDLLNPLTRQASYLAERMKELGVLMSTDGKDNNVLKIKPPLVFSKPDADQLLNTLKIVLSEDAMSLS